MWSENIKSESVVVPVAAMRGTQALLPRNFDGCLPQATSRMSKCSGRAAMDGAAEIVSEHLAAGRPVRRLMERPPRQSGSGDSKKDGEE